VLTARYEAELQVALGPDSDMSDEQQKAWLQQQDRKLRILQHMAERLHAEIRENIQSANDAASHKAAATRPTSQTAPTGP
jgi:hypothetical protein